MGKTRDPRNAVDQGPWLADPSPTDGIASIGADLPPAMSDPRPDAGSADAGRPDAAGTATVAEAPDAAPTGAATTDLRAGPGAGVAAAANQPDGQPNAASVRLGGAGATPVGQLGATASVGPRRSGRCRSCGRARRRHCRRFAAGRNHAGQRRCGSPGYRRHDPGGPVEWDRAASRSPDHRGGAGPIGRRRRPRHE